MTQRPIDPPPGTDTDTDLTDTPRLPRPVGALLLKDWAPRYELPDGVDAFQAGLTLLSLRTGDLVRQQDALMKAVLDACCAAMTPDHGPLVDAALLSAEPQRALAEALMGRFTQAHLGQALGMDLPSHTLPGELQRGTLLELLEASASLVAAALLSVWTRPDAGGTLPQTEDEALARAAVVAGACPLCGHTMVACHGQLLDQRQHQVTDVHGHCDFVPETTRVILQPQQASHTDTSALWDEATGPWDWCTCSSCEHGGVAIGFVVPAPEGGA